MKNAGALLAVFLLLPLAGSPVALFEKPEPEARRMIVDAARLTPSGKIVRKFVPFHPLARMYSFTEAKFGPVTGYLREGVRVKSDGRGLVYDPPLPAKHIAFGLAASAVLLFLLYRGWKKGFSGPLLLLIPVLVRLILVLTVTGRRPEIVTAAADEPGYFTVIRDMLDGVWFSPWSFTVGLGVLYLPFILISGAREFYDIVPAFNYFSALVFAPGILLLFGLVLRRLGVSGNIHESMGTGYRSIPML